MKFSVPVGEILYALFYGCRGFVAELFDQVFYICVGVGYITWLILDASEHAIRDDYSNVMLFFVVPLTAITLTVIGLQGRNASKSPDSVTTK